MNDVSAQLKNSFELLRSLDAIRNRRAFFSLLTGGLATTLLAIFFAFITGNLAMHGNGALSAIFGITGVLVAVFTFLTALSACGIHINRQFKSLEPLSMLTGYLAAATTLPRFLGVFLLIGLISMLTMLAIIVVYFVCKLPGIGPLLYFFALPICTLIVGVMFFAFAFLTPLTGPAIWSGLNVMQVIATFWEILKTRLLTVIISFLLLNFLVGIISGLIFFGTAAGLSINLGLSLITVGSFGSNLYSAAMGIFSGYGGAGGYAIAGGLGILLLMVSVVTLPFMIWIAGACLIFDAVTENLTVTETEAKLREGLTAARAQVEQASQHIQAAANQAKNTVAQQPATHQTCSRCNESVEINEAFCGNCGNKMN